jgi:hypothetical protein
MLGKIVVGRIMRNSTVRRGEKHKAYVAYFSLPGQLARPKYRATIEELKPLLEEDVIDWLRRANCMPIKADTDMKLFAAGYKAGQEAISTGSTEIKIQTRYEWYIEQEEIYWDKLASQATDPTEQPRIQYFIPTK